MLRNELTTSFLALILQWFSCEFQPHIAEPSYLRHSFFAPTIYTDVSHLNYTDGW